MLAAEFVLVAQTIVSRQIDPQQPAVLTVGTIHGGTKNNIIPDEVTMGLHAAHLLGCGARPDCGGGAAHGEWAGGGVRHSGGPHADGDRHL